jgi:DNA polymerase-3 subunit gamma/tau
VTGRRDLELAPDPRLGFEMSLLRMLAFRPGDTPAVTVRPAPSTTFPQRQPVDAPQSGGSASRQPEVPDDSDWPGVVESLAIDGAARQLAENCALESSTPFELSLSLDERNFASWWICLGQR